MARHNPLRSAAIDRLAVLAVVALLVGACSNGPAATPTTPPSPVPAASTASPLASVAVEGATSASSAAPGGVASGGKVPAFSHVWVLVLENASFASIADGSEDPYLRGLFSKFGLAANYFGVAHPSQPNYLAMFSGSTQGVTDDDVHDISAQNLADQLDAHGKTWKIYEQGYPGDCFPGTVASSDGEGFGTSGSYSRKHDPAISFDDIRKDPSRCSNIVNFAHFDPAAADFELIVPNACNDMHSCPLATADAFLGAFVPKILTSPAFANSALFITVDEGTGQNQVATLVAGPMVKPGLSSTVRHDHYSLLRTIEDAWGLGCLANACQANNMSEFFGQ